MDRARIHEGIRRMRFTEILGRSERSELSQLDAAEWWQQVRLNLVEGSAEANGTKITGVLVSKPRMRIGDPTNVPPANPKQKSRRLDYMEADRPLVADMQNMLDVGSAKNPWDAARAVADRALGKGNPESKVKRLYEHFKILSTQSTQN